MNYIYDVHAAVPAEVRIKTLGLQSQKPGQRSFFQGTLDVVARRQSGSAALNFRLLLLRVGVIKYMVIFSPFLPCRYSSKSPGLRASFLHWKPTDSQNWGWSTTVGYSVLRFLRILESTFCLWAFWNTFCCACIHGALNGIYFPSWEYIV